jgi:hypothetical protein
LLDKILIVLIILPEKFLNVLHVGTNFEMLNDLHFMIEGVH